MPISKKKELRIKLLERCLRRSPADAMTKFELLQFINDELNHEGISGISQKTLDKDIKDIQDCGISLVHQKITGSFVDPETGADKKAKTIWYYERPSESYFENKIPPEKHEQILEALRDIAHFGSFPWIDEMVAQLSDAFGLNTNQSSRIIYQEFNEYYTGKEYVERLTSLIAHRRVLNVQYTPFGGERQEFEFHPYILKIYNNRWFCVGHEPNGDFTFRILALDRINSLQPNEATFKSCSYSEQDWLDHFEDVIGVSVPNNAQPQKITLRFFDLGRYYVTTKPIHGSQKKFHVDTNSEFLDIELELIPNYEFYQKLLSYGEQVEVIKPLELRLAMKEKTKALFERYK